MTVNPTCKTFTSTRWLRLGLVVLAAMTCTPRAACAQPVCAIQVDKRVSCNGGDFADPGFTQTCAVVTPAGCMAGGGQSVEITYQIKNVGTVDVTNCTVQDANSGGTFYGPAPAGATIAANGGLGPVVDNTTNPGTCSAVFATNEPNDATASCECAGGSVTVIADSCNQVTCGGGPPPPVLISKTCTPQSAAGNYDITLTITNLDNTSGATLDCTVTDAVYAGTCPPQGSPIGTVTLTPGTVHVAASSPSCDPSTGVGCVTGTASGTLAGQTQPTCDQAIATCTPGDGILFPPLAATAVCPFGGCFTRPLGYWGNHPNQTAMIIGGGLDSCGITLSNTGVAVEGSATEDLCESAGDAKTGKGNSFYTSRQQLDLIRACTAVALNLRVSGNGDLATGERVCEAVSPGITADFLRCCAGPASACDSGLAGADIGATGCAGILDTFSKKFDRVPLPPSILSDSADPSLCSQATGNGFANPGRNLGPK